MLIEGPSGSSWSSGRRVGPCIEVKPKRSLRTVRRADCDCLLLTSRMREGADEQASGECLGLPLAIALTRDRWGLHRNLPNHLCDRFLHVYLSLHVRQPVSAHSRFDPDPT